MADKKFNAALRKQELDRAAELEKSKAEFQSDKIIWTGTNDDFSAVVGEYKLRVYASELDPIWWWGVDYKTKTIANSVVDGPICYDLDEAKAAAEQAYINHINK